MKHVFLANLHHAYAQTDGTYDFPNSREGDMLKQAKKEIEELTGLLNAEQPKDSVADEKFDDDEWYLRVSS